MDGEDLQSAYLEVMMDEPGTSLGEFMRRVGDGRYGRPSPADVIAFLHQVERHIIGSIETRAATNPRFAEEADDRAEAVREEIAALIERYGSGGGPARSAQN